MAFSLRTVPNDSLEKRTMRWTPSTIMSSLLRGTSSIGQSDGAATIEDIRRAMLEILGDREAETYPVVQLRVTYAADVQDLWYLRGDIMAAVAATEGEAIAKARLEKFEWHVQGSVAKRPQFAGQPSGAVVAQCPQTNITSLPSATRSARFPTGNNTLV